MRDRFAQTVEKAIAERVFPGCVIGVVRSSGEREIMPFGTLRYDAQDAVREDTVYDVASVTKSIPTAVLALRMIEGGSLSLERPVAAYLPELKHDHGATIRDLLLYRVTGPRLSELAQNGPDAIARELMKRGFDGPPGARNYTNLPATLLGFIVERVGGATIDVLARDTFFEPLGMGETTFFPLRDGVDPARIAPTEIDGRGEVCGLPHDESAYVFAEAGRAVGHAGLFSTAGDLLAFIHALLADPRMTGIKSGAELGLGWQVDAPFFFGRRASERAFGKTGFTGTSVLVDARQGTGIVILSNRTYPARPDDAVSLDSPIYRFRAAVADIALSQSR